MEQPSLFDPEPILLTIPEAARRLNIGRTLAYELIGAGTLEVVHIGRSVRVPVDALHDFVQRRRIEEQSRRAPRVDSPMRRGPAAASPSSDREDRDR